jgi:hypothetical protein
MNYLISFQTHPYPLCKYSIKPTEQTTKIKGKITQIQTKINGSKKYVDVARLNSQRSPPLYKGGYSPVGFPRTPTQTVVSWPRKIVKIEILTPTKIFFYNNNGSDFDDINFLLYFIYYFLSIYL